MQTITWKDRPLRIVDCIPPAPDIYEKIDLPKQFKIRQELGFNCEHIEVHDVAEGESGITYYPSDCAIQVRKNILQEISNSYETLGINPIVYFNVHWLAEPLAKRYPEWQQKNKENDVIPSAYGKGSYTCINSRFREYAFQTIRNLTQYAIQGIFLDGPFFRIEGCYCKECKELFFKEYGYPIPHWSKASNKEKQELFQFKRYSIARFMKEANATLKKVKPDSMIYMNSPQLVPTKYCSRDNRLTVKYQDMLLAEGGFLGEDLRKVPIWKPAATAQLLETQADGKPYCVAIAGRLAPWSRYLLSHAETWLTHAMAVSHGANTWYGIYNDNNQDRRMGTVKEINRFLRINEKYFTDTKSMATIALMWSYETANVYQSSAEETDFTTGQEELADEEKGDSRGSFIGWYDALSRGKIPFDVIDDTSIIDGSFQKYELIILPNVSVMNPEQAEQIERYVKEAGKIISSFDTSLYDEYGMRRAKPLLSNILGIERIEGINNSKYDHIEIDKESHLTEGIDQTVIPAASLGTKIIPAAKTNLCMHYRRKQKSRYCELPEITSYPYIVHHSYGSGKSIYFTANVGKFYESFALPEYRILMNNAVRELVNVPVLVKTTTPNEAIHLSLRKKGEKQILLHLVNYTGSMIRPISDVIPLTDVQIELKAELRVSDVKALRKNEQLKFHQEEGTIFIQLDFLLEYEVVVVNLQ
ncbi:putative glycosyl hydrolase-like family 6 (GHL6) protein [Cytobacillus oceanisediminis]|uniref:Putative glycosyl hydrolase-like family 6 (GHL6) protein n=1 Tax=Cytobacillus oceanisediminis TaxID=665099 RepID=A0A2V2ZWB8_9BACI|nr:beta-galactosidase trimerization domain-containing protein [Cytobacillus oceanisediminis]PWW28237.1 putative glycosyl hydrolase-like family 6 (GHL6) protein [Cytobacillus oceanisediminis]